ncbi:hypothetical protein Goklo_012896 [Gossypium klotzschianum]|uniref:Uncharacterized protein n=3 Tax=Gossypium TaxID=3633 RepID=A0A7J8VEU1_9ROSI|nr:hypothetical protein [Gossypium klotzschianum]
MVVMNKIMWFACVLVSVAYLALSFIVVGGEQWLAIGITIIGSIIMFATLKTVRYWVIRHRIKVSDK